jgi:cell division protein FtsQ
MRRKRRLSSSIRWGNNSSRSKGGLLLSAALLATLALLVYWFFATDDFYIYEIKVVGNRFVSSEEVFEASGLNELSIFWVEPKKVEEAVSNLTAVKSAKVRCYLPSEVIIEVVEREPQIVWQSGEARYWVDKEGVVLTIRGEIEGMLLVEDVDEIALQPGERVDPRVVSSAKNLKLLFPEVSVLRYSRSKGIIFLYEGGWPIYLGIGDMEEKVAILKAILQRLSAEGIKPEFIDLRFKGSPYFLPEVTFISDKLDSI